MEKLTLTTPVTEYEVSGIELRWKQKLIIIVLVGSIGGEVRHIITDPQATALMVALNKADLRTNTLHKRILQQLITDGVIAGTISGAPD